LISSGIANFFANVVKFVQTEQDIGQATLMELEKKANGEKSILTGTAFSDIFLYVFNWKWLTLSSFYLELDHISLLFSVVSDFCFFHLIVRFGARFN
jgi:hypothetical protein